MTQQARVKNLIKLINEYGTQAKLAEVTGFDASFISQLKTGHRPMGEKVARSIEASTGRPPLWMDTPGDSVESPAPIYDQSGLSLMDLWESSPEEEREKFLRDLISKR